MNAIRKTIAILLFCMLSLPLCTLAFAEGETTITILCTSDVHGNIWGYSYEDNIENTDKGMARQYTYIRKVREENPNTILIDNGDAIQGTIMTDDLYNKAPDEPHPVVAAMNFMGYDAMALGNHEFNRGIPTLLKIFGTAEFPVLAANVRDAAGKLITGSGWTIAERAGIKIAIIGVVTPAVPLWDGGKEGIDACTYEAANTAVKSAIAEIGDTADLIVVAAHMGLQAEYDEENGSDSAQKILEDNPEIDVLLTGHMHTIVSVNEGRVPVGAPRNGARDIVRFDVTLDANKQVCNATVTVVDMADYAPSEELRSVPLVAEAHRKTIDFVAGVPVDGKEGGSALGTTTARFQPEDEIRGIPSGRIMDTAVVDLLNKIQLLNSGADVSSAALFKSTTDLHEGAINYGDIFNIYKYDNTLYRVPVTGAELKAYMEWSAACYNQWTPGDINISFDPEYPDFLYDMFAGVDYEIDLSQPKGNRIKNVMFQGEPLEDDRQLTLAVNNYRYSSALKAGGLVSSKKEWESSCSIRDMLVDYFAEHSPVAPEVDNNWRIVGVDLEWENPLRNELIAKINAGEIESPYHRSLNVNDYR